MSVETRHTEKNILFQLLLMRERTVELEIVIANLVAMMEPEDVKLVQQQVTEVRAKQEK